MKKNYLKLLVAILFMNLLNSCSLSKRHYLTGYNIEWRKKKTSEQKITQLNVEPIEYDSLLEMQIINYHNQDYLSDNTILASNSNNIDFFKKSLSKKTKIIYDGECDNIITKDGHEIKCKVAEIGISEIKYIRCDNLNGAIYVLNKNDVLMIQYANGTKDIMTITNQAPQKNQQISMEETVTVNHPLAAPALICSLIGWLFFGIGSLLGIIFGAIALNKIKQNPNKFKGKGMALAGLIIGIVAIFIGIIILSA